MIYKNIFSDVRFMNESYTSKSTMTPPPAYNVINENAEYIKDCSLFVTESMVNECFGDESLIEQTALLEGAKFDIFLKNFFAEGEDYKGLKKELKNIVTANQLDEEGLKSGHSKFLHGCKRILQLCADLEASFVTGSHAAAIVLNIVSLSPMGVILNIVSFVINFIINRLMRLLYDTIEFNTVRKDAEQVITQLKQNAQNAKDEKTKAKYLAEAERLEKAIDKYSGKKKESSKENNEE